MIDIVTKNGVHVQGPWKDELGAYHDSLQFTVGQPDVFPGQRSFEISWTMLSVIFQALNDEGRLNITDRQ